MDSACRICGNRDGNRSLVVTEMMFGYRDEFNYLHCSSCDCLQIVDPPANMARYYPEEYFARPSRKQQELGLKRFLRHQRARHCLYGGNILGLFLEKTFGKPSAAIFGNPDHYAHLKRCNVTFASRILDIGCGFGGLLLSLATDGFSSLTGVDPYISESKCYGNRVRLIKGDICDIDEQFDFIMLHHSFEHLGEPLLALKQINRLLSPGRYVLIRTPVASSFAYRKYGCHWAQLDAPRHLFLHTPKSIRLLAEASGFELARISYDSTAFQFWASEQYVADTPLVSERSFMVDPGNSLFSLEQIRHFEHAAMELNKKGDGDSACFYLHKS